MPEPLPVETAELSALVAQLRTANSGAPTVGGARRRRRGGLLGFTLGRLNPLFLTCDDFTISGKLPTSGLHAGTGHVPVMPPAGRPPAYRNYPPACIAVSNSVLATWTEDRVPMARAGGLIDVRHADRV